MLDYYLISPGPHASGPAEGIVVEEFTRRGDCTTAGLHNTAWMGGDPRWQSSMLLSRSMRADPGLTERVRPAERRDAEEAYRQLGGGELPGETVLRSQFHDYWAFPATRPLTLSRPVVPEGFQEQRHYRVLFAGDLEPDLLDAGPRQVRAGQDAFTWVLRRIATNLAWALDVTVLLAGSDYDSVGPMLQRLTAAVRRHGLIPLATERFS